ncbi:MAG: hypothetical protein M3340_07245 [Actinomycetota bacterium]|nr:hypothetical protein [Actinomycetota bacterium]
MALSDKQSKKRADAVAPYLEPGETIRASFLGQTPIPPWVFFLIASYIFIFFQRYRTVVLTDRNVYVMENAFLRTYKFNKVAHKSPLATARVETGGSWASIDGGPKLHVPPFGPIKRGLTDFRATLEQSRRPAIPSA